LCLTAISVQADQTGIDVGTPVSADELKKFFAIPPDGTGLPEGQGTAAAGQQIYAERCAHCHGEHLEGSKEVGGPTLTGGRGSLASAHPLKTVESYWPYATTLFDYIWRTMPFDQPGSLSPDDVYALSAYILSVGKVIDDKKILNAQTLPKVVMPNANGFYDASKSDFDTYRLKPAGQTQ
jgi:cytochrome c